VGKIAIIKLRKAKETKIFDKKQNNGRAYPFFRIKRSVFSLSLKEVYFLIN
jgi:hypothetical protein